MPGAGGSVPEEKKNEKTARLVHFTAILLGCLVQVNITFIHIHQDTCIYTHKHAYTHAYIHKLIAILLFQTNGNLKNNGIIFPKVFKMALNSEKENIIMDVYSLLNL